MDTFVVPDLHGRSYLAQGLLEQAGIIDPDGNRIDEKTVRVVQLGDLANCVAGDREIDLALLGRADEWFDVVLVGNHELPYLGGPAFGGFWQSDVSAAVHAIDWQPALAIGETLLTHAGVVPDLLTGDVESAADAANELASAWTAERGRSFYFAMIGRARGGLHQFGGVTWSDAHEPRDSRFSQVHGHTPDPSGPSIRHATNGRFSVNLDVGGHGPVRRIVGLWLDEAGEPRGDVPFEAFEATQEMLAA